MNMLICQRRASIAGCGENSVHEQSHRTWCPRFPKTGKTLGGWTRGQSQAYVRTGSRRISVMQEKVAEHLRRGKERQSGKKTSKTTCQGLRRRGRDQSDGAAGVGQKTGRRSQLRKNTEGCCMRPGDRSRSSGRRNGGRQKKVRKKWMQEVVRNM